MAQTVASNLFQNQISSFESYAGIAPKDLGLCHIIATTGIIADKLSDAHLRQKFFELLDKMQKEYGPADLSEGEVMPHLDKDSLIANWPSNEKYVVGNGIKSIGLKTQQIGSSGAAIGVHYFLDVPGDCQD